MKKNDCFKIDTRGICLLCLTPGISDLHTVTLPQLNSTNKLKQLLRYIKVKPCELFGSSPGAQSMETNGGHEVNVQVSVCSPCSSVIEEFSRLYASYVLIMVQMDNCITSVAHSIKSGSESSEKSQHFMEQMKPIGFADMINFTVASNLRSVVLEKCVKKLKLYNLESKEKTERIKYLKSDLEAREKSMDPTNRQPNITSPSLSEASDTEKLTMQEDNEQGHSDDENQLEIKGRVLRAATRLAIIKRLQTNVRCSRRKTHRRNLKKASRFKCKLCFVELSSLFSLKRHMKLVHKSVLGQQHQLPEVSIGSLHFPNGDTETSKSGPGKTKKFECEICKKVVQTKLGLALHMSKMHKEKWSFSRHQNPRRVTRTSNTVCVVEKKSENLGQSNSESKIEKPARNTKDHLKCKYCFKELSSPFSLERHIKLMHPKPKLFLKQQPSQDNPDSLQSTYPDVETTPQAALEFLTGDHNWRIPGNQGEQLNDGENGRSSSLNMNISSSESFDTENIIEQVKDEEKAFHDDQYICNTCGKGFLEETSLAVHMRSHTEKNVFAMDLHMLELDSLD